MQLAKTISTKTLIAAGVTSFGALWSIEFILKQNRPEWRRPSHFLESGSTHLSTFFKLSGAAFARACDVGKLGQKIQELIVKYVPYKEICLSGYDLVKPSVTMATSWVQFVAGYIEVLKQRKGLSIFFVSLAVILGPMVAYHRGAASHPAVLAASIRIQALFSKAPRLASSLSVASSSSV